MPVTRKWIEIYTLSAGVLLLAFAVAVGISDLANAGFIPPHDPLLGISIRYLFWTGAALFFIAAVFCFLQKGVFHVTLFILWLTISFEVYQIGFLSLGGKTLSGYWEGLAYTFGLSIQTTNFIIQIAALYLLAGSVLTLVGLWLNAKKAVREQTNSLKMSCPACGGHVQFNLQNVGQSIPCPHCQKTITLCQPDNLKMSCFFCQGHIEFPPHALGEKMKCPHCNHDITLKEQATT